MECKNGVKMISFLPLMTTFTKVDVVASLSTKPAPKLQNKPLDLQEPKEGETLGVGEQKYDTNT